MNKKITFLSVLILTVEICPSTVIPPKPLYPGYGISNAICTTARFLFREIKLVTELTDVLIPLLKMIWFVLKTKVLSFNAARA